MEARVLRHNLTNRCWERRDGKMKKETPYSATTIFLKRFTARDGEQTLKREKEGEREREGHDEV